jgi:hypothetical protein
LNNKVEPKKQYGYPICWSKEGFEWYPYLPAVVRFHYPIFRGMSANPEITYDGSGFRLEDQEISLWMNIEHVMTTTCEVLQAGRIYSLEHFTPQPPSEYGYVQRHSQHKFAKKSMIKSRNAFQRLLAYCSFAAAAHRNTGPVSNHLPSSHSDAISTVYQKIGSNLPNVHILIKNLFLTIDEMRQSGNFTGVVINYAEKYHYPAV